MPIASQCVIFGASQWKQLTTHSGHGVVSMTGVVPEPDDDVTAGLVDGVCGCLDGIVAGGSVVLGSFVGLLRFGFVETVGG